MLTKEHLVEQAIIYETKQEWQNAIQSYLQAVALDSKNADLRNSLGIMYEKVKAFDYAETCYRQALEIEPTFYAARYNLIQLYRVQERVADTQKLIIDLYVATADRNERKELTALLKELHGEEVAVCDQCGCLSPHTKAFQRRLDKILCPYCRFEKEKHSNQIVLFSQAALFALLLIGVVGTLFFITQPNILALHYLATNLLLTVVAYFGFQILHETIHVVTAVLVGGKLQNIAFGQGEFVWKRDIGLFTISLHKQPGLSISVFGFPHRPRFARLRGLFVLLAPAFFHIGICIALWQGLPYWHFASMYAIRDVIVLANLLLLHTLIPYYLQPSFISDGLFILVLLISKEAPDFLVGGYYSKKASLDCGRKDYKKALQWIETGIELQKKPTTDLLMGAASYALADGQLQKACTYAEQLLQIYPDNPDAQAAGFNMVAYTKLFLGELEDAHHYAQKALQLRPWSSCEMDTLGTVLVETGDIEAGSRHLEEGLRRHSHDSNRASTSAAIAYAYWRKGDEIQAETWLGKAAVLDDSVYMMRHVRDKMALQPQA